MGVTMLIRLTEMGVTGSVEKNLDGSVLQQLVNVLKSVGMD